MLLTGFIVGIIILLLCGISDQSRNEKIKKMNSKEYQEYKRTGKFPKRLS